jgi:hypothetical protein
LRGYGFEYLLAFTPVSGFSSVFDEAGCIYPVYNLVMVLLTVMPAFVSYHCIHEVTLQVPCVRRLFGAEQMTAALFSLIAGLITRYSELFHDKTWKRENGSSCVSASWSAFTG